MSEVQLLASHLVTSNDLLSRPLDKEKATAIADSIREIGLIAPIMVRPGKIFRNGIHVDGWVILAGRHRHYAMATVLEWPEIPCLVFEGDELRAELVTLDENLQRNTLSEAERARQLARRKEIYEALHPETVHGANQHTARSRQIGDSSSTRFTKEAAKLTGKSERTIQRDVARAEALGPDLDLIAGTSLDKGVEIDALASMPPEERRPIIEKAKRGEAVTARPRPFDEAVPPPSDEQTVEAEVERLMDAWNTAGPKAQQLFLNKIEAISIAA